MSSSNILLESKSRYSLQYSRIIPRTLSWNTLVLFRLYSRLSLLSWIWLKVNLKWVIVKYYSMTILFLSILRVNWTLSSILALSRYILRNPSTVTQRLWTTYLKRAPRGLQFVCGPAISQHWFSLKALLLSILPLHYGSHVRIQIEPGDCGYTVLKTLLCGRSPYFSGMFEGRFSEG